MRSMSLWRRLLDAWWSALSKPESCGRQRCVDKQNNKRVFPGVGRLGWGWGLLCPIPGNFLPGEGLRQLDLSALPSPCTGSQREGRAFPAGEIRGRTGWTAPCSSLRRVLPVGSEGSASGVWLQRLVCSQRWRCWGAQHPPPPAVERGNPSF